MTGSHELIASLLALGCNGCSAMNIFFDVDHTLIHKPRA